jgi:hypothetical protein
MADQPVTVRYTNWRGETAIRRLILGDVRFGSNEWHPDPTWLIRAFDVDHPAKIWKDFDLTKCDFTAGSAGAVDPDDDTRDGILFRLWVRAGSYPGGWPRRLSELFQDHGPKIGENVQPRHYRAALIALAKEKGINLP